MKKFRNRKTDRDPEVSALSYMILKDVGICTRCLGQWAEKGHVICQNCIAYWREHNKLHNQITRYKSKVTTIKRSA